MASRAVSAVRSEVASGPESAENDGCQLIDISPNGFGSRNTGLDGPDEHEMERRAGLDRGWSSDPWRAKAHCLQNAGEDRSAKAGWDRCLPFSVVGLPLLRS